MQLVEHISEKLNTMHGEVLCIFLIRQKDEDTMESALLNFAICLYCPSNSLEEVVKRCPDTELQERDMPIRTTAGMELVVFGVMRDFVGRLALALVSL